MDAEEKAKQFAAEVEARAKELPRIQRNTMDEVVKQLGVAQQRVTDLLSGKPTDSAQRRLRAQQAEVERLLEDLRQTMTAAAIEGSGSAWGAGEQMVTAPFAVAGVSMSGLVIDTRALMAGQRFMTDRITDISKRALNRLNATLLQNIIGTQSLSDTVSDVQKILGGVTRSRAMTVTYTEVGRAYSIAQDERMQEAGAIVPGLRKGWLPSGKRFPRLSHVRAGSQIVGFDQPFLVDGEKLQYPRDRAGSAKNTINCGCLSRPIVDGSSFGAGEVRIDDDGHAHIVGPQGGIVRRLP